MTGNPLKIYVAGMKASTTYHMRAVVKYNDGKVGMDSDQTFKTGSLPKEILEGATVKTGAGAMPQSGVELVDATLSDLPNYLEAYVTDLRGI